MVILSLFLTSLTPIINVSALKEDTWDYFDTNGVYYYNPDGDTECYMDCSTPTGDQITWIGDSYTEGLKPQIESTFSGVDIHSQVSKHFGSDVSGNDSGLTIAKQLKNSNQLRKVVVFALGTNDGVLSGDAAAITASQTTISKQIDELVNTVGGSTRIILTTAKTTNGMVFDGVNNAITEAMNKYQNISVADWASVATETSFTSDGVHPSEEGSKLYLDTIQKNLKNCTITGGSTASLPGNTNMEKIWNWLISNVPELSDKPEVVAGILGNLQGESSFNPFAYNKSSNRFGLIQMSIGQGHWQKLVDAGLDQYVYSNTAPQDAVDQAIQIELSYLFLEGGYSGGIAKFLEKLNVVSNKSGVEGARAYSDLWLVIIERAVNGSDSLEDSGVIQYQREMYSGHPQYQGVKYQGASGRRKHAEDIFSSLASSGVVSASSGGSSQCINYGAGLTGNGYDTVEEAENAIMKEYKAITPRSYGVSAEGDKYLKSMGIGNVNCASGTDLENCVAFSAWFVNKFGPTKVSGLPNGSQVVDKLAQYGYQTGNTPKLYAVFSTASGSTMCGAVLCGHTGVVLGINESKGTIIIGEAGCSNADFTGAHEYSLSKFSSGYKYAYINPTGLN